MFKTEFKPLKGNLKPSERGLKHYKILLTLLEESEIEYSSTDQLLVIQLANTLGQLEYYEEELQKHGIILDSGKTNPVLPAISSTRGNITKMLDSLYLTPKARKSLDNKVDDPFADLLKGMEVIEE